MNKDCEIVSDLLPNYIENLTSEATNEYIKEHIKNCNECKIKLANMSENIEKKQEEKKEIDYLKKLNKMTIYKSLKIGISIGIIFLIIIYLILIIYRYNIVNSSIKKFENYKYSTNFYIEQNLMIISNDNSVKSFVKQKNWFKDNILKVEYESTTFPETNNNTTIFDYNNNKTYIMNNKDKTINIIEGVNSYNPNEMLYSLIGNNYDKNNYNKILNIWYHPSIYSTWNDYVIENINLDKQTGLLKYYKESVYTGEEEKDDTYYQWFMYNFNSVSDEDVFFDISIYNTIDSQIINWLY